MYISKAFIPILKNNPTEAKIKSHKLMLRVGMIKQSSTGIYSWLPLGFKIMKKIEKIVRDEQNKPNTRNVVLRDFSIENLTIRFHTDKRSSKIKDIKNNKAICLIGYDKKAKLQIRIDADAYTIEDEKILMDIWKKMYPMSRECYRVSKSPGDKIESLDEIKFNEDDESNLIGFSNFTAIQCDIKSIEILYLNHKANIRAKYNNINGILNGEWVIP